MTIRPHKAISSEDKKTLIFALEELRDRGLPLPEGTDGLFKKPILTWPTDTKGYFVKNDGKIYVPTEAQGGFIESTQRYSLFRGGRGCISGDTVINGVPIAERKNADFVDTIYGKSIASPGYLKGKANLYSVETEGGAKVSVTKLHRFLTPKGWFPLLQLKVGDLILSDGAWHKNKRAQNFFSKIKNVKFEGFEDFYDLSVPEFGHYSAQGIYHHNSGKSGAGSQKALRKIIQGENGAVMNPTFSDFVDSTWQEFKQWIPWNMVVPSQRHRFSDAWQPNKPFRMVFLNNVFVICKGLKNPDSARGPNINWLWYDEGRNDPTGLGWKNAISSVRVGNNPQAWNTTTPVGISHWIYEFFEEKKVYPEVVEILEELGYSMEKDLFASFHGSITDNKTNLDPMFYASIISSYPTGYLRRREVEGEYADAGGKIGDASWFRDKILDELLSDQKKILRYWDLAATEKKQASDDPDEMVGSLVSKHKGESADKPLFIIQDQKHGFWGDDKAIEAIANVARADGPFIPVWVEQEPGASGKITVAAVKKHFKRFPELSAHSVHGLDVKKVGDRVLAANLLWFNVAQEGRIYMMRGSWNKETLKQIDGFTQVKHDDRVTSVTNAMFVLNPYKSWSKSQFMTI